MGLMSGGLKIGGVDGEEKLRPMTARSVRRKLSSLRTYFRYLVREGKLTEDPTEIVVAPKMGKRLPVFVPDYQMDEVLDKHASDKDFANIRDRMVLMTAYYTGMRRSELVALKLEDVDFKSKTIQIRRSMEYRYSAKEWRIGEPKSKSGYRTIPLTEEAVTILNKQKEKNKRISEISTEWEEFVFLCRKGTPVKNSTYDTALFKI